MGAKKKPGSFEKILFPTDFSRASVAAADYALSLARANKARLYVLFVVDIRDYSTNFYGHPLPHVKLDREAREPAMAALKRFASERFKGYRNIELKVLGGRPYEEITKFVKGMNIDLVVMGASSRTGVARMLLGSNVDKVMRTANCSVMVVQNP